MATNFFEQQDAARRRTGLLIFYFVLAVVAIVATVYIAVTGILLGVGARQGGSGDLFDPLRVAAVATIVGLVIALGSLYKIVALREGGAAVARLLGGRLVDPASGVLAERKLLNVVEEMALASGTPVPPVFVLDNEASINAFAAGFAPGDAVVAVSRGCLDHLTRDEMQGVVAHEFSHILNGDMRLDLQVMGLLHGILLLSLIGQIIMRVTQNSSIRTRSSNDRDSKGDMGAALFLFGLALLVIGWAGVFFGRLIKAAISRQREYLADASAVQFTRNPDGIAGALKKIGGLAQGSRIQDAHAEEACHLFFSAGVPSFTALLATHPPLVERIRRIDPSFDGQFVPIAPDEAPVEEEEKTRPRSKQPPRLFPTGAVPSAEAPGALSALDLAAGVAAAGAPQRAHVDTASTLVAALPSPLLQAVREPFTARAVVYALLLDSDPAVRRVQLDHLEAEAERGTSAEVVKLVPLIVSLGAAARLPLVELALPALRQLSGSQYQQFRNTVEFLVASDRKLSLFEFALQRMLRRHLDRHFRQRRPDMDRYAALGPVSDHLALLLSSLAYTGHAQREGTARAFEEGMERFGIARTTAGMLPREACSLAGLDRTLDRLAESAPQVKSRVLDACVATIASDGRVTIAEGELLRAIADSLDCPIPPLLAGAVSAPELPRATALEHPAPLLPS
jgi:Zn-dependent protease with chaperone function